MVPKSIRECLEYIRDSVGETQVRYRAAAVVALKELSALESQLAAQDSAVEVLEAYRSQGKRVTVAVEVYDTKGTSKRGHAATFAEAVEQVRAMMEQEATDAKAKPA